jgi:hypothetical protein
MALFRFEQRRVNCFENRFSQQSGTYYLFNPWTGETVFDMTYGVRVSLPSFLLFFFSSFLLFIPPSFLAHLSVGLFPPQTRHGMHDMSLTILLLLLLLPPRCEVSPVRGASQM